MTFRGITGQHLSLGLCLGLALLLVTQSAPPILALVCGGVLAQLLGSPAWASKTSHRLLGASIVALGCGLDLGAALESLKDGILVASLTIGGVFAIGVPLARRLDVPRTSALLVIAGTAICGGSAIAAAAPALRARSEETAASLGVVFALNGLALLCLPWLGTFFGLDAEEFGTWCALATHDTSAVVGAAATHGESARDTATTQKLGRALWIVPVAWLLARRQAKVRSTAAVKVDQLPQKVPVFLVWFVAASTLVTVLPALRAPGEAVAGAASSGMTLALFFAGLSVSGRALRSISGVTLLLGTILWLLLGTSSLLFVLAG